MFCVYYAKPQVSDTAVCGQSKNLCIVIGDKTFLVEHSGNYAGFGGMVWRSEFILGESIEATVRTRRLLWSEALLSMDNHRLPNKVISGELENAGQRGPGRKKK